MLTPSMGFSSNTVSILSPILKICFHNLWPCMFRGLYTLTSYDGISMMGYIYNVLVWNSFWYRLLQLNWIITYRAKHGKNTAAIVSGRKNDTQTA